MITRTCGNCGYFNERETLGKDVGECVVNPPTVVVTTDSKKKSEPNAFYPVVASDQPGCRFFAGEPIQTKAIQLSQGKAVNPNLQD